MTTSENQTPAPQSQARQIPHSVDAALAEWARHHHHVGQIDQEGKRLDAQITAMQQQLSELGQRYTDLGRILHEAQEEERIARAMAERGCQLAGVDMPPVPPAAPPAAPLPVPVLPAGAEPIPADTNVLGQGVAGHATSETITDPPDGGGTATPDFQPDPQGDGGDRGDTGTRGRRAGRRGR